MKRSRLVQDYLRDILDAMDKAEEFVLDLDLRAFRIDEKRLLQLFAALRSSARRPRKFRQITDAVSQIFLSDWPLKVMVTV